MSCFMCKVFHIQHYFDKLLNEHGTFDINMENSIYRTEQYSYRQINRQSKQTNTVTCHMHLQSFTSRPIEVTFVLPCLEFIIAAYVGDWLPDMKSGRFASDCHYLNSHTTYENLAPSHSLKSKQYSDNQHYKVRYQLITHVIYMVRFERSSEFGKCQIHLLRTTSGIVKVVHKITFNTVAKNFLDVALKTSNKNSTHLYTICFDLQISIICLFVHKTFCVDMTVLTFLRL